MAFSSFRSSAQRSPSLLRLAGALVTLVLCSLAASACSTGSDDPADTTVGDPTGTGTGTGTPPETLACAGTLPTDDVSAAVNKVSAGGAALGALPHFWTTYGLGRLGLYLDRDLLAPEFQAQDRDTHDGKRWSAVLREQTVEAVSTLELRSVRAHGLFHDDIGIYKEDASGNPVYDFSRSDNIFDFLNDNGIAPIVELASMPAALAKDATQTVFDWKMIVSPPKDYAKWQGLVQAFVQHSVERYGADVVNKWYFEVWNEPECCTMKFFKGTLDEYFQLYDTAAAGVRAALPAGRVGGPVSSQPVELTTNSMVGTKFLDHVATAGSPLDFFTFHTWSFIDGAVGGYFQGLDLLDQHGKTDVQIAVTEFGPTWEFGLRGVKGTAGNEPEWEPQETIQSAAFVAQVYSNIAQRCATEGKRFPITYAWWTLSDVFDEGYDDPGDDTLEENPFIGAMGLYNREGIKKPAYHAYSYLAQLGDQQLPLSATGAGGVGGMATQKTQDGSIQVLLYNGQSPGQGYKNDTYYTVAAAQDIGVTVTGLDPSVAYNVTLQRVDETHGNAWGAWNTLGRPTLANMDAPAWQTVRDAMASPPESLGAALCGATFSKTVNLASPGAALLTFAPAVK